MRKLSLDALARELLERASGAASSRAAQTVAGGRERVLRQTVIALARGAVLGEHANPGEATLQVLHGRVRLTAGGDSWEGRRGDLLVIPESAHELAALQDSAVLLTVATHT